MKNLIIIGVLLYVFSRKSEAPATTTVTTTTPPTPKKTPVIIDNGGTGGGGGSTTPTGAYVFEFFQQSDSNITAHLVSHSRVATPVADTPPNATATSEQWLYGPGGELVAHIKDNVGGHHPNFFDAVNMENASKGLKDRIAFWVQNFVAVHPFSNYESRGNNHNAYFNRTLKTGTYRWVYHNTSNTRHSLFAGYANSETENVKLNVISEAGTFTEYSVEVALHPTDQAVPFKFNSNNYQL